MSPATYVTLTDFILSLFNQETYSDITILIRNVTLPAHRLVICLQCPYFEDKFPDTFAQRKGILEFQQGSGIAYWRVFQYLYTGDYSDEATNKDLEGK